MEGFVQSLGPAIVGAIGGAIVAGITGYLAVRSRPARKVQNQQVLVDAAEDVVQLQRQAIIDLNEQIKEVKDEFTRFREEADEIKLKAEEIRKKHIQEIAGLKQSMTKLKNRVITLENQIKGLGHEPLPFEEDSPNGEKNNSEMELTEPF